MPLGFVNTLFDIRTRFFPLKLDVLKIFAATRLKCSQFVLIAVLMIFTLRRGECIIGVVCPSVGVCLGKNPKLHFW